MIHRFLFVLQEETTNIQNKTNDRIIELEKENVEIKKIIRKLEREENNSRHPVVKDTVKEADFIHQLYVIEYLNITSTFLSYHFAHTRFQ